MSEVEMSKEEQVLQMVKKVLTDVARDTHAKPGIKHPLADNTIIGIRDCLALISARQQELAKAAGRESSMRPRFIDEPQSTVVVPIENLKRNKPKSKDK